MTVFNREETLGGRNDAPARENDRAQEASRGRRMGGRTQGVNEGRGGKETRVLQLTYALKQNRTSWGAGGLRVAEKSGRQEFCGKNSIFGTSYNSIFGPSLHFTVPTSVSWDTHTLWPP